MITTERNSRLDAARFDMLNARFIHTRRTLGIVQTTKDFATVHEHHVVLVDVMPRWLLSAD